MHVMRNIFIMNPASGKGRHRNDILFEIRDAAVQQGCYLADLSAMDLRYETLDGAHPTIDGHRVIAEAWIRQLEDLGLLQPSAGSGRDSASEGERK